MNFINRQMGDKKSENGWSTKKKIGVGVLVFFVILIAAGALMPSEEKEEVTEPAKFQTSNLSLSPSEVEPGQSVTISVDVKNTGGESGTKTVEFNVGGKSKTRDITLGAGESDEVSISVTKQEEGTFNVNVSGMSESFEVTVPAEFEVSNLDVKPQKVDPSQNVNISIDVRNTGDIKGTEALELLVNGEKVDEKQVTLSPSKSKNVDFSISKDKIGTYKAEIAGISKNFKVQSKVVVEYEVTTKFNSAYLRVSVTGPETSYNIQLTGPDKQTVGEGYISKDDMTDGTEATDVSMTELLTERKNPKPGQYTLLIKEFFSDETVFKTTPNYDKWEVSITNTSFKTSYYFSGNIEKITVTGKNSSDLPVFADEMKVIIDGEESKETLFDEPLPPGETTQIETVAFITNLEKGVHPVTIELYSGETRLNSYDTEVEIG